VASYQEHLDRAHRNERFADALTVPGQGDWKIIACFYAALHYVEAVIVANGAGSSDHNSRMNHVRTMPALAPIRNAYQTLANFAWQARYDPGIDYRDPAVARHVKKLCSLLPNMRAGLGLPPPP